MNLWQALTEAAAKLALISDIEDPRFESEVLLRYAIGINRAQLYIDPKKKLEPESEKKFREWVERRLRGEPVAYIIRCREFYGLDFYVDPRVLIPRPETELLVEEAIKLTRNNSVKAIADIGTGSGAIAVSLAVNLPDVQIYATDISPDALEVAGINSVKNRVNQQITLLQGDLLKPLPEPVDLLIANLPYVPQSEAARMPSAKYEPKLALDGGEEGLDQILRLIDGLAGHVKHGGWVLLEIGIGQSKAIVDHFRECFPAASITMIPDLAGIERVVKARN